MVREFFATGMIVSLVGAGVLGSAMAWSNQTEVVHTEHVGSIAFDFGANGELLQPHAIDIGPPGRSPSRVLDGQIRNTGAFAIVLDNISSVQITDVTNGGVIPGAAPCLATNFTARFVNDDEFRQNAAVLPGSVGGRFHVDMGINGDAPASCADQDLSYTLRIITRTSGSPALSPTGLTGKSDAGAVIVTVTPPPAAPTASATATASPSVTATASPSATATASPSASATASPSATATASPTQTATATASPSATASASASATASPSATATEPPSATASPSASSTVTKP